MLVTAAKQNRIATFADFKHFYLDSSKRFFYLFTFLDRYMRVRLYV